MDGKKEQHFVKYLKRAAAHHEAKATHHGKLSKSHSSIADATEDASIAQHHRDISKAHAALGEVHAMHGADLGRLVSHFEEPDVDVIDEHEDAADDLKDAQRDELMKSVIGL